MNFKIINPITATAKDILFSGNHLEIGRYTALNQGRLAICGNDSEGLATLGYYNGNKWELTPIHVQSLGQASTTGNLITLYVGNDNVWFGF